MHELNAILEVGRDRNACRNAVLARMIQQQIAITGAGVAG